MDPVFALALDLPPPGSRQRLQALHRQLRSAILDGRLRPGLRLPASRALAGLLGVSRNTAVGAYDLLLSGGYLVARTGAGTYVADLLPRRPAAAPRPAAADARLAPAWRQGPAAPPAPSPAPAVPVQDDFRVGLPDVGAFAFDVWRRLSDRALRRLARMPADYAQAQGQPALRQAIAQHVAFTRAVACGADDVVVTSGAQQAFQLLAQVLVTPGRTVVAVESLCYPALHAALRGASARIAAVPTDDEGLCVEQLPPDARVVCVTPSHQFPLGMAMSVRRRAALIAWARARGAVLVEDDYDSEFRYAGRPLDALQTLDAGGGSVCYVGTFSKSLFPALRLGFVVAPTWARDALVRAREQADWHSPVLAQEALAAFIAEGHLARHLRRMRKVYGARRETLLQALQRHAGGRLRPIPSEAGLHLSAFLPGGDADALAARAARAGIAVSPLARFAVPGLPAVPSGLAFGFGLIAAERVDGAIGRLARLL